MTETEKIANDIQAKYELYLTSLTFTILALSVQYASFGIHLFVDILQIVSWILLLISVISGLRRLGYVPVILHYHAAKEQQLAIDENHLLKVQSIVDSRMYWYCFVFGLIILVIAKSIVPLENILMCFCSLM